MSAPARADMTKHFATNRQMYSDDLRRRAAARVGLGPTANAAEIFNTVLDGTTFGSGAALDTRPADPGRAYSQGEEEDAGAAKRLDAMRRAMAKRLGLPEDTSLDDVLAAGLKGVQDQRDATKPGNAATGESPWKAKGYQGGSSRPGGEESALPNAQTNFAKAAAFTKRRAEIYSDISKEIPNKNHAFSVAQLRAAEQDPEGFKAYSEAK